MPFSNPVRAVQTADAIQSAGVPPIDNPTPLSIVFQQPVAAGSAWTSGHIDCSQWQSFVGTMFSAATSAGTGSNPYTKMTVDWSLSVDNYDPLRQEDWVVPNTPYNFTYVYRNDMQGPMYGDSVQFTFYNYDSEPTLVTYGFFGSYRTRVRSDIRGRYQWNSDGTSNDAAGLGSDSVIIAANYGTIAANTLSGGTLMNLFNGPVTVSGNASGGANVEWSVIIRPEPYSVLGNQIIIPGQNQANQNALTPTLLYLPRRVCALYVFNNSTTTAITGAQIVVTGQEQPE